MGRVAATDAVVVDLRARPARARVAHLPEIVLHVERQNLALRKVLLPDVPGLVVSRDVGLLGVTAVVGRIQAGRVNLVDLGQQLPSPADGLLLEVIAEGPVPQHLEEGMMVHILAHILQVIVLPTRTDALLGIHGALQLGEGVAWVDLADKDRLELVHASVDEEQGRIVVRHDGGGRDEGVVALLRKEIDEGLADFSARPLATGAPCTARRPR
mmetsp:Transcript_136892/g.425291  ORF Transcript_136892/g.425291 Transcript_136892/m.425291 type:complete len:213 (+) Transcript_136892:2805-3443(+)